MKSVRLNKRYKSMIQDKAMDAVREKYTTKRESASTLYKKQVIKDIEQRLVPLMVLAEKLGVTALLKKETWFPYLAHGVSLKAHDLSFPVSGFNFYNRYRSGGEFCNKFDTQLALVYQPLLDANEQKWREEQDKVSAKQNALESLLSEVRTTKQLEACWPEAPDYYPAELLEERNS